MIRHSTKNFRSRLLLASGLGASLLVTGAVAQVTPTSDTSAPGTDRESSRNQRAVTQGQGTQQGQVATEAPERVLVTGSFIPTAEGEGPLPVAVFTSDDLRKFGATSATEGLRRLPSFVGAATTENDSNAGSGRAGVNLRGLGEINTLVLINGHRAGIPGAFSGFTDANAIPFGAIDRVEVLKDGASATYGSDAVAGVVNYILKTEYQGAQIDFLYGNTTNNDAGTERASVLTGFQSKDKRFNVVLNANYYHANAIFSRDRFLSSSANATRLGGVDTGNQNYPGTILDANLTDANGNTVLGGTGSGVLIGGTSSSVVPTSIADYRPFADASTAKTSDNINFRQFTPSIPEQERFAYYAASDYQIIDQALDIYAQGIYSNNRQYNGLAPAPFAVFDPDVLAASPFNPAPDVINAIGFRTVTGGPRLSLFDHRFYMGIFGLKGHLFKTFDYDVSYTHVEDKQIETDSGDFRRSVLEGAISDGSFNPFVGINAPPSGTVTVNGVTSTYDNVAVLSRASYIADTVIFNNLDIAEARLSNTFVPDAPQGGLSLALGGEYRRESYDEQHDPIQQSGDTLGFNAAANYHATQDVKSVFGEALLPIVAPTMNIPGIYSLSFTVAGRYQKFTLNGFDFLSGQGIDPTFSNTNEKFAFEYQPIQDIKIRGSYSTSFRAPPIAGGGGLFAQAVAGGDFPDIRDPVLGTTYQPRDGGIVGGNPALEPEETDSYSIGLVLSPRFAPGLNVTVDYYQLNTNNVIITGGDIAQFVVNNESTFPERIVRGGTIDPATGVREITSIDERPLNAARRGVEGLDLTVFYELDTMDKFKMDLGKFNFTLAYNHFFRFNGQLNSSQGFTNFVGDFSSAPLTPGSIPNNKGLFQLEWAYKGFDFVSTVNYIGDYVDDPSTSFGGQSPTADSNDPANPVYAKTRRVREYVTLDLQLSYTVKAPEAPAEQPSSKDGKDYKGGKQVASAPGVGANLFQKILGGTTLTVGCNDVFDTPPPFASGAFNDNYDTSLYTIRNRFIYGAITKKF